MVGQRRQRRRDVERGDPPVEPQRIRLGGEPVMAELQAHDVSRPGEKIAIDINLRRASLFDARSERAI